MMHDEEGMYDPVPCPLILTMKITKKKMGSGLNALNVAT